MLKASTFTVQHPGILTIDENGTVNPHAKGETLVTVKVGEHTETITLKVGDTRKVDVEKSTISTTAIEVAAGKKVKVIVDLKDQYGMEFADTVKASNATDVSVIESEVTAIQVVEEGKDIVGQYQLELEAVDESAKGDVIVKAGETVLGKINVTVKVAGEAATYELTTENTEFDLKTAEGKANKQLTLKAFDLDGLEAQFNAADFIYESSDKEVITVDEKTGEVTLVATEAGKTAKVVAKKVEGALDEQVAEIEFTVIDSTPVITEVTFTSSPALQNTLNVDFSKLASVIATGSKGDVKIAYQLVGNDTLEIVEADAEGEALAPAIVLGKVTFSPEVTIDMNDNGTIQFEESVEGKTITASFINNKDSFIKDVKLEFVKEEN